MDPKKERRRQQQGGLWAVVQLHGVWTLESWLPNMSFNVAQKDSGRQEPIPPSQSTPAAKSTAIVRRIFQFGGTPSNPLSPTSPTSPCLSQVRMVLFHELDCDWTEVNGEEGYHEWVYNLRPRFRCKSSPSTLSSRQQHGCWIRFLGRIFTDDWNKEGWTHRTYNWCEEVLLQHKFIVGNVTSC